MNRDGLDKLLDFTTPDPAVWSCYVSVSSDPAALRELPAQVTGLLTAAAVQIAPVGHPPRELSPADLSPALEATRAHGRDWLGHSVAIFTAERLGLLEVAVLPCRVSERAVLGVRPYVRPLLTAMSRSPRHCAAVVDRGHARIYLVDDQQVTPLDEVDGQGLRAHRFGGWHGLQTWRINRRATELTHRHYLTVAETLDRAMRRTRCAVFTLGGHAYETADFLRATPGPLRERYAGDFVADPHTPTPARVRELSGTTIAHWRTTRERRLLDELRDSSSGATGLPACVAAANRGAIRLLVVPEEEIVPGFACAGCGRLALAAGDCPRCGISLAHVADIVEELLVSVIQHGGDVETAGEIPRPAGVAAKLRFPGATR